MNPHFFTIPMAPHFLCIQNTGHFFLPSFDTTCICGVLFCWLDISPFHSMAQAIVNLLRISSNQKEKKKKTLLNDSLYIEKTGHGGLDCGCDM